MNSPVSKILVVSTLVLLLIFLAIPELEAQCPMCKMAAESNLKNGGTDGAGLNRGILYMLLTPYLLVGTIAFLWWRNRKRGVDNV